MEKIKIICGKCEKPMKKHVLDSYEYEFGFPIKNVKCYRCDNCGNITFTEKQADLMKEKTEKLKKRLFAFERKISYSGKSLILSIPSDLVEYLNMKKGQKVRVLPVSNEGFFVKVKK